jgi:hypothetical protein
VNIRKLAKKFMNRYSFSSKGGLRGSYPLVCAGPREVSHEGAHYCYVIIATRVISRFWYLLECP